MFVDSHCHLDRLNYEKLGNLEEILSRARENNICKFLCIATNLDTFEKVHTIAKNNSDVFCSAGVHPLQDSYFEVDSERLYQQAQNSNVIAIGETGLDYHYSPENAAWQQKALIKHIEIAKRVKKPLIIHSRNAQQDTLRIFEEHDAQQIGGILHCFTETAEMAMSAVEMGFMISFSGILTFKSAEQLRKVASQIPLNKILIETDCPWLTPVPYRGKDNQPLHVIEVAKILSELKGISVDEIATQTTNNFHAMFPSTTH